MADLVNRLVLDIGPTLKAIDQVAARLDKAIQDQDVEVAVDFGALDAAADLVEFMDGASPAVEVGVDAGGLDGLDGLIDSFDGSSVEVGVDADFAGLDSAADLVEFLDGASPAVEVGVDAGGLDGLDNVIDGLDATISVDVDADFASLDSAADLVEFMDGASPAVEVGVDAGGLDNLDSVISGLESSIAVDVDADFASLDSAADLVEFLDGASPAVTVGVDAGGLDELDSVIDGLESSISVGIDADFAGLDSAADLVEFLDGASPAVTIGVDAGGLDGLDSLIDGLDSDVAVTVDADFASLDAAADLVEFIDGASPALTLGVDTGGLDQLDTVINGLDGTISVDVDADFAALDSTADLIEFIDGATPAVDVGVNAGELDGLDRVIDGLNETVDIDLEINGLSAAQSALDGLGEDIRPEVIPELDESAVGSIIDQLSNPFALAGEAAGGIWGVAFGDGLNLDAALGQVEGQLGLTEAESAAIGEAAGNLYANAYGESIESNLEPLAALAKFELVATSDVEGLELAGGRVQDFAQILEVDAFEALTAVNQLVEEGLSDDYANGLDQILTLAQKSKVPNEELIETFKEYAPNLADAGISFDEFSTVLISGGASSAIEIDKVADAIKEMTLKVDAIEDKNIKAITEASGLATPEVEALVESLQNGEAGSFQQVVEIMNSIEDPVKRAAFSMEFFGNAGEEAANVLLAADFETPFETIVGGVDAAGIALNDNLKTNLLGVLRQGFEPLTAFIGDSVLPRLNDFAKFLLDLDPAEVIAGMLDFIGTLADGVGTVASFITENDLLIPILAGLGAVVLSVVIPAITAGITAMGTWIAATAIAAAPFVALGLAVAAVAAGFVLAYQNVEPFRDLVDDVVELVSTTAVEAFELFLEIVETVSEFFTDEFFPLFDEFQDVVEPALEYVAALLEGDFSKAWEAGQDVVREAVAGIGRVLRNLVSSATGLLARFGPVVVGSIRRGLAGLGAAVRSSFGPASSAILTWVDEAVGSVASFGGDLIDTVLEGLGALPARLGASLGPAVGTLVTWVGEALAVVGPFASDLVDRVLEGLAALPARLGTMLGQATGEIITWVSEALASVTGFGGLFGDSVLSSLATLPVQLAAILAGATAQIVVWVGQMIAEAIKLAPAFITAIVGGLATLAAQIPQVLAGVITAVVTWTGTLVSEAIKAAANFVDGFLSGLLGIDVGVAGALAGAITRVIGWTAELIALVVNVGADFTTALVSGLAAAAGAVIGVLQPIIDFVGGAFTDVWAAAQIAIGIVWDGITGGIAAAAGLIIPILQPIVDFVAGAFTAVWTALQITIEAVWTAISEAISAAWAVVQPVLDGAVEFLAGAFSQAFQNLQITVELVWAAISAAVETAWAVIQPVLNAIIDFVAGAFTNAWEGLLITIEFVWGGISAAISASWAVFKPVLDTIIGFVSGAFTAVWDALAVTVETAWSAIANSVSTAWALIQPVLNIISDVITGGFTLIWTGLQATIEGVWNGITGSIEAAAGTIGGLVNGITGTIQGAIDLIGGLVNAIQNIPAIPDIDVPFLRQGAYIPNVGPQGMLARIGDGVDEVVAPVDDMARTVSLFHMSGRLPNLVRAIERMGLVRAYGRDSGGSGARNLTINKTSNTNSVPAPRPPRGGGDLPPIRIASGPTYVTVKSAGALPGTQLRTLGKHIARGRRTRLT